jgi:hypothetical protein
MQLPLGFGALDFGNLEFQEWMRGWVSAFISGGAGAVTAGFVVGANDPQHYNLATLKFYELVGSVFLTSGLLSAMNFWRTKPLPDAKKREVTVEVTEVKGKPVATVTTTKETSIVPVEAPKQDQDSR